MSVGYTERVVNLAGDVDAGDESRNTGVRDSLRIEIRSATRLWLYVAPVAVAPIPAEFSSLRSLSLPYHRPTRSPHITPHELL